MTPESPVVRIVESGGHVSVFEAGPEVDLGLDGLGTDAIAYETGADEVVRLLDPIVAELRDLERSRNAGPRSRSYLPEGWHPSAPYDYPPELAPYVPVAGRHERLRVDPDGTVTTGGTIPRMYNREGEEKYLVAAVPKRAKAANYRHNSGIPSGIDQRIPCRERNCPECRAIDAEGSVIL